MSHTKCATAVTEVGWRSTKVGGNAMELLRENVFRKNAYC